MAFLMDCDDLTGTYLERLIELAMVDKAPQIYKPREGKVLA